MNVDQDQVQSCYAMANMGFLPIDAAMVSYIKSLLVTSYDVSRTSVPTDS